MSSKNLCFKAATRGLICYSYSETLLGDSRFSHCPGNFRLFHLNLTNLGNPIDLGSVIVALYNIPKCARTLTCTLKMIIDM